ncbi:EamA family transporter [Mesorhizobium sp. NBSH29]|uniref:DMT family transporter n=1 Tax=Mesorhizobium sp. NBSH29 TaxID=2654249 RepID=UPI0018966A59|nr:DMT family transporter [Mesorhizobium sp. NBSH29]QPC86637.1 EamA family transporter [Mesorhizobium sp. NBSH29]
MASTTIDNSIPAKLDMATLVIIAITVVAWASAFPAIRAGLTAFGAAELGAVRFGIAAVPAAIYLIIMRPALPALGEAWRFAFGGIFFVAFYTVLLNFGEQTVSAGAASFIINVNPIITVILALLLLGERFRPIAWLGMIISFSGIGLIALGEGGGLKVDSGALLILGAAFCTSAAMIVQKPLFKKHNALTVAMWNMVIGALCLSPMLPGGLKQAASSDSHALFAVIYLGIVPSLIAYGTWAMVLSRMPASRAANFQYCVPPVATAMGFLWLGEVPGWVSVAGGALALGGVILVNLRR